jgi:hypothetical protein
MQRGFELLVLGLFVVPDMECYGQTELVTFRKAKGIADLTLHAISLLNLNLQTLQH